MRNTAALAESFDGAGISYRDFGGDGPALVLLPGLACTQVLWDPVLPHLSAFQAVTLDYPGFGSSTAVERDWTMQNFARDVLAVVETLKLERVTLVGHSMGGAVALEAAALAPERVRAVIGCDSFTYPTIYERVSDAAIDDAMAPFRADWAGAVRSVMPAFLRPDGDPDIHALALDTMARADPARAVASLEHLLRWDLVASLERCPVPVSTINAAGFLAEEIRQRYASQMTIRTLDGVGHFMMLERPEAFAAVVAEVAAAAHR